MAQTLCLASVLLLDRQTQLKGATVDLGCENVSSISTAGLSVRAMVVPIIAKPLPLIAPNLLTSTTEGRPDMPRRWFFAAPPQCRPQATADQRLQDQLHGWTASLARLVLEVDAQAIILILLHGRRQPGILKCQRAAFENDRQRAAANVRRCRRGR